MKRSFPGMVWSVFCIRWFMKHFLLMFFLFFHFASFAQKETNTVIDGEKINSIVISSDEIFRISITAAPVEKITIKTMADGEYSNDISLDSKVKGETLFLTSRYRAILKSGFDKLSAHKVFAMEVVMEIPENLDVEVVSNLASVIGKGHFEDLFIQLKSGYCELKNFTGNAIINTYDGDVDIKTSSAVVEASSRHGRINVPSGSFGANTIQISSINGDIRVKKTK